MTRRNRAKANRSKQTKQRKQQRREGKKNRQQKRERTRAAKKRNQEHLPAEDGRGPADFRRHVAGVMVQRAIEKAAARAS